MLNFIPLGVFMAKAKTVIGWVLSLASVAEQIRKCFWSLKNGKN